MNSAKIAVVYKSNYGTTRQYAAWLAEALSADLMEMPARAKELDGYDLIVHGGGLYASGILGADMLARVSGRKLVLFTVGLADPAATDYSDILEKNLSPELRPEVKVFHLRGGIDYQKLGLVHRGLMALKRKMTAKMPPEQLSAEDRAFLDTYGRKVDFTDRRTVQPIVDYVRAQIL